MKKEVFRESNVSKYVFTGEDFIAETVLYKYNTYRDRTVICCSTQSGCRVACKFCGTGNQFIRNLTKDEIVNQIKEVMGDVDFNPKDIEKFQIMFMSMGEPMHNWDNVELAIRELHLLYPNADLLISTVGIEDSKVARKIISLSNEIHKVGLQFSIHKSNDADRNKLIPFENKMSLRRLRDFGLLWANDTGRSVYLNYCIDGTNNTEVDINNLKNIFSDLYFNFTFSVICSNNENMKEAGFKKLDVIREFENSFIGDGYNTRVFNPDAQDSFGGGCGQLWHTQKWMREYLVR